MFELYTALILGLAGSLHCIGMCGPIALSLPLPATSFINRLPAVLLYNLGRTITYALMGAVIGLLGKGIQLAGFQQWASVLIGSLMVLSVLLPALFKRMKAPSRIFDAYSAAIVKRFGGLFRNPSLKSLFLIGLLNGLLPCGLVYVALAAALNTGDVLNAIVFMLVFGAGTIPVMAGISIVRSMLTAGIRQKVNKILSFMIVVLGLLFILRGLSLGIPYISPDDGVLKTEREAGAACCSGKASE